MLKLVARLKPHSVVADHTNGLWLALILKATRFPLKVIYRQHGCEFLTKQPHLARLVLQRVDEIITVSEPEADALRRLTDRFVSVVPNCLPAHCLHACPVNEVDKDSQGPRIAHIGVLSKDKGIFAFIKLISAIREGHREVQAVAVGRILLDCASGYSEDDLLSEMDGAGIIYPGEVAREIVFQHVDLLVVCSRRESFGLTMLEAPFHGVTPVAFDSPGARFLLGDVTECLVENGNLEQMKEAVLRLWHNPHQRSVICKHLRTRFLRQLDPNLIATNLLATIERSGQMG
jgi:glycosyltransferase involved in cell wall biosynthesis